MSKMRMRHPKRHKQAIARAITYHPDLTDEQKRLAMYLLRFADENGVIRSPSINAMIAEVDDGLRDWSPDGSH